MTAKETFEHLTAKYPESKIETHENYERDFNYISVKIDEVYECSIGRVLTWEQLAANAEMKLPTPEQRRAQKMAKATALREKARTAEFEAMAIERSLNREQGHPVAEALLMKHPTAEFQENE